MECPPVLKSRIVGHHVSLKYLFKVQVSDHHQPLIDSLHQITCSLDLTLPQEYFHELMSLMTPRELLIPTTGPLNEDWTDVVLRLIADGPKLSDVWVRKMVVRWSASIDSTSTLFFHSCCQDLEIDPQ